MKTKLVIALAVLAAATMGWLQWQTQKKWQSENESLSRQLADLKADNENLSNRLAAASDFKKLSDEQMNELLRLRAEVARLRRRTNEIRTLPKETLPAQNDPVPAPPNESNDPLEHQKRVSDAKMNDAKDLLLEFLAAADAHQGQFPSEIDDANLYTRPDFSGTNNFEIVYHGTRNAIADPSKTILIREYLAWPTVDGKWAKAYGFADGHAEIHTEPDGNFGPWEQQHSPPSNQ